MADPRGRLVVVGTGIRTVGQLTVEAMAWLQAADHVFHLVADPVAKEVIAAWQPGTETSLVDFYVDGGRRREAYDAMVATVADAVRAGLTVCAAFYGHPGVFANPSHELIALLRSEGHAAEMLPGISAEDCLFADLGVDPGKGCHSYDATDFINFDHHADPTVHLLLWQTGMLGDWTHRGQRDVRDNLVLLVEKLSHWYPVDHPVIVYQASIHPEKPPRADTVGLGTLPDVALTSGCTLYVPPSRSRRRDSAHAGRLRRTT